MDVEITKYSEETCKEKGQWIPRQISTKEEKCPGSGQMTSSKAEMSKVKLDAMNSKGCYFCFK